MLLHTLQYIINHLCREHSGQNLLLNYHTDFGKNLFQRFDKLKRTIQKINHCQPGFVGITSEIIESQSPLPVAVLDVPSVPPLIVVAVSDVPSPTVVVVT